MDTLSTNTLSSGIPLGAMGAMKGLSRPGMGMGMGMGSGPHNHGDCGDYFRILMVVLLIALFIALLFTACSPREYFTATDPRDGVVPPVDEYIPRPELIKEESSKTIILAPPRNSDNTFAGRASIFKRLDEFRIDISANLTVLKPEPLGPMPETAVYSVFLSDGISILEPIGQLTLVGQDYKHTFTSPDPERFGKLSRVYISFDQGDSRQVVLQGKI
jgi:hypothetical protein